MGSRAALAAGGRIAEPAPAKINLYLHVVGRRPDGYHLLDSLVGFVDLGDRVTVAPAPGAGPRLTLDGRHAADLPAGEDNLVLHAARRLAAALDRPPDVAVHLTKELPVSSGIGGGSADAAAVLRALGRLWEVDPAAVLGSGLARLGADVPVCLASATRFVSGIGETLAAGPDLAGLPAVLANPAVPVSTADVFRTRAGDFSGPGTFDERPARPADLIDIIAERRNDLAPAARALAPVIAEVERRLAATPGCRLARMSGSGATCFGLYADSTAADQAARALAAARPGWWVRRARFL